MEKVIDPDDREFLQSEIVSITSVGTLSKEEEIMDDTNEAEPTVGRETTASPTVEKKVETYKNLLTGITASGKNINSSEHLASDIENKSESKDVFENVIDSECVTKESVSRNRTPTAKYVSNTEKNNIRNKTPKQKFNEKLKCLKFGTKEEISAVEVDKTEEIEILKTPEGKDKKLVNLSSGSKSSRVTETPKTDTQTFSPSKCKSTPGKRKHIESQKERGSTRPSDDFVPSSHKKVTTKSNSFGTDMEESDEIIHSIPDISAHLKPRTRTPKTDVKANASQQQMNNQDKTPRLTRNKAAAKQLIHPVGTDLNVDVTPHRKRLSSAVKGAPEPVNEESVDSKLELAEDSDLDTINKPERELIEPRRTRKSVGSHIKAKTPKGDREPAEKLVKTPLSLRKRQSLGSAKKAVTKAQELRETRKRVLPTDVSDASDADSEVTFPKLRVSILRKVILTLSDSILVVEKVLILSRTLAISASRILQNLF